MTPPTAPPGVAAPPAPLFSCSDIAKRIAAQRGKCNRSSVWRAIGRLGIEPTLRTPAGACYYNGELVARIEASMRSANGDDAE